jgi:formate hydrogenlyase transcriptional activator
VPRPARILSLAHEVVLAHDFHGIVSLWSQAAERLYGWNAREIVGRPVHELLETRFPVSLDDALETVQRSGQWRGELVQTTRGGQQISVDSHWSLQFDEDGSPIGVSRLDQDLALVRLSKPDEEPSEVNFRMLVDHSPLGIFVANADGRYIDVNPAAEKMLGYTKAEILELSIADIVVPADRPKIAPEVARFADRGVVRSDWTFRRKDGSVFPGEVVGCQLPDGRLQAIVSDLTEHQQREESLRQKSEQLRALLEISQKLTSKLDLQALLAAASSCLRGSVAYDSAALVLPETGGMMRICPLDSEVLRGLIDEEIVVPWDPSLAEQVPRDGSVRLLSSDEFRFASSFFLSRLARAGVRSMCCTMLCLGSDSTGSVWLGRNSENAFSASDLDWIRQVAVLLSIALENSRAYLQIAELKNKLAAGKKILEQDTQSEFNIDEIVGTSSALKHALDQAHMVADTDATVLITGETGTGKELIARIIHRASPRGAHSFVKMNCAAIPAGLLESELFGYEKGAFTHAVARKQGRIELADQGTLFLDEIGEMPLEVQPKMLRVLQDQEFERLGSTHTLRVSARLIAATNRDLFSSVAQKEFRSDLFYRLNVFPIHLPPLRERREDIPGLVRHFVNKHARRLKRPITRIPERALEVLTRWEWPGNIRELENFIERAVILSPYGVLNAPLAELVAMEELMEGDDLEQLQRSTIIEALRKSNGVIAGRTGAAARLGVKRTTLQSKLLRMRINASEYQRNKDAN